VTANNSTVKTFYTYAHYRADQPERGPFYIGKGTGPRAWKTSGTGRSKWWQRIVAKHGLKVEILAPWPTEDDAYSHERLMIECFRDLGDLVNLTSGGDGLRDPDGSIRARIGSKIRRHWEDPARRAHWLAQRSTPEVVAKKSKALREAFAAPGSKEKRSAAVKASHSRPEVRERILKNAADPGYRAKLSAGVKAALARPEAKSRKSAASKAMWKDEKHRERFADLMRQKAEERWATLPPEKAAKLRHAAELDRARKERKRSENVNRID
jgi:hypothetical protein